jgi:Transcriptional regulator
MTLSADQRRDTASHILDVAEKHFALYGYAGTTLRGIIKEAQVNVAAVAYHFGNKEELFGAVVRRFALPVVEEQLTRLETVTAEAQSSFNQPALTDVLRAFYEPPIVMIKGLGEKGETLSLFLGRAQTEPDPIYSLIDGQFSACRNRFIKAFRQLLPGLTEADYQWRFEFMLALIVSVLNRQRMIRKRYTNDPDWDANEVIERLVRFCAAGFLGLNAGGVRG